MFIEQPPLILRWLYPRAFWRMDKNEKAVYLTFDDGPIPEITPWVLDLLDINLSYTVVTAPYDGYTGRRTLEPGQFVHASLKKNKK